MIMICQVVIDWVRVFFSEKLNSLLMPLVLLTSKLCRWEGNEQVMPTYQPVITPSLSC